MRLNHGRNQKFLIFCDRKPYAPPLQHVWPVAMNEVDKQAFDVRAVVILQHRSSQHYEREILRHAKSHVVDNASIQRAYVTLHISHNLICHNHQSSVSQCLYFIIRFVLFPVFQAHDFHNIPNFCVAHDLKRNIVISSVKTQEDVTLRRMKEIFSANSNVGCLNTDCFGNQKFIIGPLRYPDLQHSSTMGTKYPVHLLTIQYWWCQGTKMETTML